MTLEEIRSKYLAYFEARGHTVIPSARLVPENDPTTLFTGSGMQPMVPYLLGKDHPAGKRITDSQKAFRSGDIDEVGDNRHTTFFEMLGNWSLGDYFKEEQLPWIFEFLTEEIHLDPKRLYVTAFLGDAANNLPQDTESTDIWKKLFANKGIDAGVAVIGSEADGYARGIKEGERIFYYEAKKNWWSRAGTPEKMPAGEPGGPDSEIFYEFTEIPHDTSFGEHCHPNCDCGRFLEICNSVFMQYVKNADGTFSLLPKQNVDFGGGLERIVMASTNSPDIIAVCHRPILDYLERASGKVYGVGTEDIRSFRIIADHMKAAVFLIADNVVPSKSEQGYFVRRLIRRSVQHSDKLGISNNGFANIVRPVAEMYAHSYPEIMQNIETIERVIAEEEEQFRKTLHRGVLELQKILDKNERITGAEAFDLYQTYGFPLELTREVANDIRRMMQESMPSMARDVLVEEESFFEMLQKHKDLSRSGSEQKFKGGLADTSEKTTRLHTAHHLLLGALQKVLGPHVKQRGSNITQERLRIDFSHGEKMTEEQKREVERIVNEKISEDIPMIRSEMAREEAEKLGAEREFGQKYPDFVSVYSLGPKTATQENPQYGEAFSIEFCGGPHVEHTGELANSGVFKIQKEEAVSQGVRRIKAVLE